MSDPNQQNPSNPQPVSPSPSALVTNNNPVEQKPIPLYDPNLIPEYNPFSQTVSEPVVEPELLPEPPQIQNPFQAQNLTGVNPAQDAATIPTQQPNSNSTQASQFLAPNTPTQNNSYSEINGNNQITQPTFAQTTKFVPLPMPEFPPIEKITPAANTVSPTVNTVESNTPPVIAAPIVQVQQPASASQEYLGKKKEGFNLFKFIFNLLPSIILVALIAMIVIIAKNFVDKTTITDFSEIGPAIIFHTTYNSETDRLEWLLLPPTPLGLTATIPKDFEKSDKVNITCPIKSSNDIMDIVQSIINPKLGSCAFRAL